MEPAETPLTTAAESEPAGYIVDLTFGDEILGVSLSKRADYTINNHDLFIAVGGQYLRIDIEETYSDIRSKTEADCVGVQVGAGYTKTRNNWGCELGVNLGIGAGYFESNANYEGYAGDDDGADLYIYNEIYGRMTYKRVGFKVGMGVFDGEESLIYGASYNW
jgi:hypothetical protein